MGGREPEDQRTMAALLVLLFGFLLFGFSLYALSWAGWVD